MKLETLTVESIKIGMKQAIASFGPDTVLLKASREGKKHRLLIAHPGGTSARTKTAMPIQRGGSAGTTKVSLADIDLVTGELRPRRLTTSGATSLQQIVKDEAKVDRSSRTRKGSSSDRLQARKLRRLRSHPDYVSLLKNFDETGISSALRSTLLDLLVDTEHSASLAKKLIEIVVERLPETTEIDLTRNIHFLNGGYGVGKTSVAFKMAQQINQLEPGRAMVINYSSDQDSSWTTAAIIGARLGVEVYPASSVQELTQLIEEKSEHNLLLIDISTYNTDDITALREHFIAASFHLVAPSDTCLTNLQRLSKAFQWDSLIVTRLDSSSFSWSLYQVLLESQIPLSLGTRESASDGPVVVVTAEQLGALIESGANLEHNTAQRINNQAPQPTETRTALH